MEEIIQSLDDIHIKWEKNKSSDEISMSLIAIKHHQLNAEFPMFSRTSFIA